MSFLDDFAALDGTVLTESDLALAPRPPWPAIRRTVIQRASDRRIGSILPKVNWVSFGLRLSRIAN